MLTHITTEAKFRCPDQRGRQPQSEVIVAENQEPNLACKFNIESLVGDLTQKGFSVAPSEDPGRFLCNYI